jgi:uncharacterized protein YciI
MYLILLNYKVPIEEVERATPAHREFLDRAYQAEKLLLSGPKVPRTGGVIIARTKTREEVDQLICEDPFFSEKNCRHEVIEFQALKFLPALASLVKP